jgi:hypothetical protein
LYVSDWCRENEGGEVNFAEITALDLAEKLRVFYTETEPRQTAKRLEKLPPKLAAEYHRSSLKNIRAAINRHLHDINRDINVVRDTEFKAANKMLDGKVKYNVKEGLSRPVQHKAIIGKKDLIKIDTYLNSSVQNPVILRYRVWYNLAVHFCTRGLEFHHQLSLNSFDFSVDEDGNDFAYINHETKQKNHQGGIDTDVADGEQAKKRMYARPDETHCPVKLLHMLIDKTDPSAVSLFNHCSRDDSSVTMYINKSVKQYQFSRFMGDISRNSVCTQNYTAHCLRATAITALSDAGVELRFIMFMSGHKCEGSIRSYVRECSSPQKLAISDTLSAALSGKPSDHIPLADVSNSAHAVSVTAPRDRFDIEAVRS